MSEKSEIRNNETMYITDERDIESIRDIILSKKYFRNRGKDIEGHCSAFERSFAAVMGVDYSLMVTSGTNALLCALSALDLKEGDEVIMPCFTFFATAVAIVNAKATPVIVNVDQTLMIDALEVEKAITKKTRAIIAVHMDGHACDMFALKKIAEEHQLALIEDVAQACGGSFKSQRLGSIGDAGCFSFNVDKIISCGEGGAIISNSRLIYEKSLCLQDACCSFGPTFKDAFTKIEPFVGQSMRVSELSGALMSVQLSRLDEILARLRKRQSLLREAFIQRGIELIPTHDQSGDCGTSLYLKFSALDECRSALVRLAQEKIVAIPINIRPAHACWQWMHLIAKERPEGRYVKADYLNSIDLLMRTLKINTPFEMDLDQTEEYAKKIAALIS